MNLCVHSDKIYTRSTMLGGVWTFLSSVIFICIRGAFANNSSYSLNAMMKILQSFHTQYKNLTIIPYQIYTWYSVPITNMGNTPKTKFYHWQINHENKVKVIWTLQVGHFYIENHSLHQIQFTFSIWYWQNNEELTLT